jgi:shikimate kinase
MIYALIGHRGVGKTQFLDRVRSYYEDIGQKVYVFDLDQEIVSRQKKSIQQIFTDHGEQAFRKIENSTLLELINEVEPQSASGAVYIALGAGFKGTVPIHVKVLWITRPTDGSGRVFLDRPRLDMNVSPFVEYMQRYEAREIRYREIYHKEIPLAEGFTDKNKVEPVLLGLKPFNINAGFTLLPYLFQNEIRLEDFISEKLLMGASFLELRDDLLNQQQIERIVREVPASKLLYSFRSRDNQAKVEWIQKLRYDWALELGECPYKNPPILSLHNRIGDESVEEAAARLISQEAQHYKLALTIRSHLELWAGHQWYLEDPENRSFLPMSPPAVKESLWKWYRLIYGSKMKISFVRDVKGSAFDQPSLFDWVRVVQDRGPYKGNEFAALLGAPVEHSRTPSEHSSFFAKRNWPVVVIPMDEKEANQINLSILDRMGLCAAAVTAPLKEAVARAYRSPSQAVNTIAKNLRTHKWSTENTDIKGFQALLKNAGLPEKIAVWGGGGTREALRSALPRAPFFSARSSELVTDHNWVGGVGPAHADTFNPECLVWAVGRSRMADCQWPPTKWKPKLILDLNYTEDSPGREYALRCGARYISGLEMFKAQAAEQQLFWSKTL